MTFVDLLSLLGSLMSLIIGVFAIFIAFHQKKEADKVNDKTMRLLLEVKTDAKIVASIAIPELQKYGETMRRMIFRISENGDSKESDSLSKKIELSVSNNYQEISELISDFKTDINSKSIEALDIENLKSKIQQLEILMSTKEKKVLRELNYITNDIEIDLSIINKKNLKVSYGHFSTLSYFLNSIYLNYMENIVPIWTYGEKWVLKNIRSGHHILKEGTYHDKRSLEEAGILPGDKLILCKIQN